MTGLTETELDAVELEVLWGRLVSIVDECGATLVRSSFSTIVRESNDFSCMLFDREGNCLAHSTTGGGLHVGTLPRTMKHFLRAFEQEGWRPGDVAITNDPWLGCGHLNDIVVATPVFHRGRLIGFSGAEAHSPDIGGVSWAADARDAYEEGFRIPIVKIAREHHLNPELVETWLANVRVPNEVRGDFYSQLAAIHDGTRKLVDFLTEYGLDDLDVLGRAIQGRAERAMRNAIAAVPDDTYRVRLPLDGFDEELEIAVAVTVRGEEIAVDYDGTSPQVGYGLNSPYTYTYSYTVYGLKCALDPHTPNNQGSHRPISVTAPDRSILNPRWPAPVSGRHLAGHRLPLGMFAALHAAVPDQVIADCGTPPHRSVYSGAYEDGRPFSQTLFGSGGWGAGSRADGLSCTVFPGNAGSSPIEVIESVAPILVHQKELITDSGGPGRFRGGLGQRMVLELLAPARASLFVDRVKHPPLGLSGGEPAGPSGVRLRAGRPIPSKGRSQLEAGDVLVIDCAGGGGYGDPRERDRAAVVRDVEQGLVSAAAAAASYGVRVGREDG